MCEICFHPSTDLCPDGACRACHKHMTYEDCLRAHELHTQWSEARARGDFKEADRLRGLLNGIVL